MTRQHSDSGAPQPPDRATAAFPASPPQAAVAHLITATNKTIAAAHAHGRRVVTLRDHLIARCMFAVARRLARMAWRIAEAGRRRLA